MNPPRYASEIELPRAPFMLGRARALDSSFEHRMERAQVAPSAREGLAWPHGVDLWNAGFPWEAHECFEIPWRRARAQAGAHGPAIVLRGLIQASAALVHLLAERRDRFARLAERASASLTCEVRYDECARFAPGLEWQDFAREWRAFEQQACPTIETRPYLVLRMPR